MLQNKMGRRYFFFFFYNKATEKPGQCGEKLSPGIVRVPAEV